MLDARGGAGGRRRYGASHVRSLVRSPAVRRACLVLAALAVATLSLSAWTNRKGHRFRGANGGEAPEWPVEEVADAERSGVPEFSAAEGSSQQQQQGGIPEFSAAASVPEFDSRQDGGSDRQGGTEEETAQESAAAAEGPEKSGGAGASAIIDKLLGDVFGGRGGDGGEGGNSGEGAESVHGPATARPDGKSPAEQAGPTQQAAAAAGAWMPNEDGSDCVRIADLPESMASSPLAHGTREGCCAANACPGDGAAGSPTAAEPGPSAVAASSPTEPPRAPAVAGGPTCRDDPSFTFVDDAAHLTRTCFSCESASVLLSVSCTHTLTQRFQ